jgi:hypothetical protein
MRSIVFTVALLCPGLTLALSGREVIDAAQREHHFSTWHTRSLSALMRSYDGETLARERDIDISEQTDPQGVHKTFIAFRGPADVQGTLFLHLSPRARKDEQWLWTPQTRRSRRLAEAQQDENFFGSDLSYRDLELIVRIQQWTDAEATATLQPDEAVEGKPCQVVDLVPKEHEEFPYRRYRLWFAVADHLLWRVDVHDDADQVLKRVVFRKYERVQDVGTATEADVLNVPGGTHTLFTMREVKYDVDLPESMFTLGFMEKGQ